MKFHRRAAGALAIGIAVLAVVGFVVFHPSRPLYMTQREVEFETNDGVVLRGTISMPRWAAKPVPGVVLVHGSGPLTRSHMLSDTRMLVQLGFAVLAYDKRGAGESSGEYLNSSAHSASVILNRLGADAASALDLLAREPDVDASRIGFLGASQAGWVIPIASQLSVVVPRFQVLFSGPAVSTGVEHLYSDLTGDGHRPPRVSDREEIERLVQDFRGDPGFDPRPMLATCRIPTLWLLGDQDESVPTFATVRVLEGIRASGNMSHTLVRFPRGDHGLRDVDSGMSEPVWENTMEWMRSIGVVPGERFDPAAAEHR